jgi:ferrous iron transport protein B
MHPAPLIALVGNPNAGKSALFNALTGARQKVGNYPGVTVERHSGLEGSRL